MFNDVNITTAKVATVLSGGGFCFGKIGARLRTCLVGNGGCIGLHSITGTLGVGIRCTGGAIRIVDSGPCARRAGAGLSAVSKATCSGRGCSVGTGPRVFGSICAGSTCGTVERSLISVGGVSRGCACTRCMSSNTSFGDRNGAGVTVGSIATVFDKCCEFRFKFRPGVGGFCRCPKCEVYGPCVGSRLRSTGRTASSFVRQVRNLSSERGVGYVTSSVYGHVACVSRGATNVGRVFASRNIIGNLYKACTGTFVCLYRETSVPYVDVMSGART